MQFFTVNHHLAMPALGHERRHLQHSAARRLPLYPVYDRSDAAVQHVEKCHSGHETVFVVKVLALTFNCRFAAKSKIAVWRTLGKRLSAFQVNSS